MGAGVACIKYLLFAFNVVFWLAGMGVLGIGIWMYVDPGFFNSFMGNFSFKIPAIILMAGGGVVMFTGFCGCLGAIKEVKCLLGSFCFMLLLLFCAEVACGVLAFIFKSKINDKINVETSSIVKTKYGLPTERDLTHVVDKAQEKFKCCGAKNPNDYDTSKWLTDNGYSSGQGCVPEFVTFAEKHMLIIGAVAIGVAATQLIGIVLSLCLMFSINDY
eukprot:gene18040-19847_t